MINIATHRLCLAISVMGFWALSAGVYNATADETDGRQVHVLVVADTDDSRIGKHVLADKFTVLTILTGGIPESRRNLKVLEGSAATPENVLEYYRSLEITSQDAILFYYAGHGAIDDQFGHVLTMQTANLSRKTLVKTIQEKHARLSVILTDCCSSFGEIPAAYADVAPNPATIRYLLLRHQGTVDLTAADLGKPAYGNQFGGLFTNALFALLTVPPERLDADGDLIPTWKEVWDRVLLNVSANSLDLLSRDRRLGKSSESKPQLQTPHAFAVNAQPVGQRLPKPKDRFGVEVKTAPDGGVEVTEAFPASPAEWYGIQKGDVITAFNGDEVKSREQFQKAVSRIPANWPAPIATEVKRLGHEGLLHFEFLLAD